MSSSGVTQYVVTFHYQENQLTTLLKLSSTMTNAGFSTTLNDEEGHPHELGSNSFGIVSALSADDLHAQAKGIGELVLGKQPEVEVQTLKAFNEQARG